MNTFLEICNFPRLQQSEPWASRCSAGFRKGRGTRDQIANICWIIEKARECRKTSTSALLSMPKPLTVWITTNWKIRKRWEYQTTWPASWEICMQVRKQHVELDREECTGFRLEKEYIKAVYYHPAYLTSIQSTSWETLSWKSTSWNQDCREKYQ